jgi:hypothetical protein
VAKPNTHRGLYLIGDKAAGRVTHVQIVHAAGDTIPLSLNAYVARGIKPNFESLPWREDIKIRWAQPKRE